ncbi:hypothetical protein F5Y11DRAFT_362167 [Daldinia sp. FL1419]|nr:hypothetical protein F5Y11DRAFT_362167 [Daldinia sp. FL1419]
MDKRSISHNSSGNSQQTSSWANVVKNKKHNGKNDDLGRGIVTLKPKGNDKSNTISGQGDKVAASFACSTKSRPPTFKDQYLQKMQAAKQLAHMKNGMEQQEANSTKVTQDAAAHISELASMKATISTLNEDLSRKNNDLIQAKAAVAAKDLQIEELQISLSMMREDIRSITLATQEHVDESAAKDELIAKLECDNAELRDSIHTGIIYISQVYGPGSDQAFTRMASMQTEPLEPVAEGNINNCPVHSQTYQQIPDSQYSPCPLHALKQTNGAPRIQTIQQSRSNQEPGLKKDDPMDEKGDSFSNEDSRSTEGVPQPVTSNCQPMKQTDSSLENVGVSMTENQDTNTEMTSRDADYLIRAAKAIMRDYPKTANDTEMVQKDGLIEKDNDVVPKTKNLSDLDPSIVKLAPVLPYDSNVDDMTDATTLYAPTPATEDGNNQGNGQSQENKDDNFESVDGRYRFRAIQESVDVMDGTAVAKAAVEYLKSTGPPTIETDQQPIRVSTPAFNEKIQSHKTEQSRTNQSSEVSYSPQAKSPVTEIILSKEGENTSESHQKSDGWKDVVIRNKSSKQLRNKKKRKSRISFALLENENLSTDQNITENVTKLVPREKGILASLQKRRTNKRPSGTIIGSNSAFSRAAKGLEGEDKVSINKGSVESKQKGASPPPRTTTSFSWAEEVEEEELQRKRTKP